MSRYNEAIQNAVGLILVSQEYKREEGKDNDSAND